MFGDTMGGLLELGLAGQRWWVHRSAKKKGNVSLSLTGSTVSNIEGGSPERENRNADAIVQ